MFANSIFHHLGYAVHNIAITADYYLKEGWELSGIDIDTIQNTRIAFLIKKDFPLIELIAPVDENSPVTNTLNKMGVTPYHVCYEVDNIEQSVEELKKLKFIPLFKPVPAVALGHRLICYLYNKDVGLIELLNKN